MRPLGSFHQLHVRLRRSLVSLLEIAPSTARNKVVPCMGTTGPPWNYVIDRKLPSTSSAILASVIVPRKDRVPRKPELRHGPPHLVAHLQHRWCTHVAPNRDQRVIAIVNDLRFSKEQKANRTPHVAHVERLVIAVENQNLVTYQIPSPSCEI